jgi:hypothetical protein
MKTINTLLLHSLILASLFIPSLSFALGDYTVLTPLPCTTTMNDGNPDCGKESKTTNLDTYLPGVLRFSILLSAFLAFVMISYGGFLYMTSDSINNKSEGKGYINNAIIGLLLVLSSYSILYTINPKLVKFNLEIPTPTINLPAGVTADPGVNTKVLQPATISALANLTQACGCKPRITSTTGGSHTVGSKHYEGKAFDVGPDPVLDKFITGGKLSSEITTSCQTISKNINGSTVNFMFEKKGVKCGTVASNGDHWHISIP